MEVGGKIKPIWEQTYDQRCNPLKPWPGEVASNQPKEGVIFREGQPLSMDREGNWVPIELPELPRDQHGYIKAGLVFEKEATEKAPSVLQRLEALEERLKFLEDLVAGRVRVEEGTTSYQIVPGYISRPPPSKSSCAVPGHALRGHQRLSSRP